MSTTNEQLAAIAIITGNTARATAEFRAELSDLLSAHRLTISERSLHWVAFDGVRGGYWQARCVISRGRRSVEVIAMDRSHPAIALRVMQSDIAEMCEVRYFCGERRVGVFASAA